MPWSPSSPAATYKKCVLELGGSDPFIVLDLEALGGLTGTVTEATEARLGNTGQSCIAAKRIIVLAEFYDDVVEGLAEQFAAVHPGDPTDPATRLRSAVVAAGCRPPG